MRPRQSSLGITALPLSLRLSRPSFNEAEAIKPRNRSWTGVSGPVRSGFNEAEAIKPRNPERYGIGRSHWACFNEAEAIKPRNLGVLFQGRPPEEALQ